MMDNSAKYVSSMVTKFKLEVAMYEAVRDQNTVMTLKKGKVETEAQGSRP